MVRGLVLLSSRGCRAGVTWSGQGHVEVVEIESSLRSGSTSTGEVGPSRQLTEVGAPRVLVCSSVGELVAHDNVTEYM